MEGESIMKKIFYTLILVGGIFLTAQLCFAEEEGIDASDPTKIYSYVGLGVKYTDYTNNESMTEARVTGNLGLSPSDMVLFELGYGWHDGDSGNDNDITNARFRYFHLFSMDYSVETGYRGMSSQADLQLSGSLKGTDGQNVITLGALPAFGINDKWNFLLGGNLVNAFDKDFKKWKGTGLGIAPLFVYVPDNWWKGAYLQIWPNYTYYVVGDNKDEGSGVIDIITGGNITSTQKWGVTFQQSFSKDFGPYIRGRDTGLKNDWNILISIFNYF